MWAKINRGNKNKDRELRARGAKIIFKLPSDGDALEKCD